MALYKIRYIHCFKKIIGYYEWIEKNVGRRFVESNEYKNKDVR